MKNLLVLLCCMLASMLNAQDLIYKTNGDTIPAKVIEVGTNAISYKKFKSPDGPLFVENKNTIRKIKFANGDVQEFNKTGDEQSSKQEDMKNGESSSGNSTSQENKKDEKTKIEITDNGYTINGQKASQKEVDRKLGSSKNPAVVLGLKGAKAMKTSQKIVKITSIPTTISGSVLSLVKVIDLWNDVQRGRTTSKSYTNAIFSILPTITLPITNKILSKKSNKMYTKLIDMYNVTN